MKLIRGDLLTPAQREQVLSMFVYRWTHENPMRGRVYGKCPCCGVLGGEPSESATRIPCRQIHPPIALSTDATWLREHAFWITNTGRLDNNRHHAEPACLADA
jgi:hypothetical protein